MKGKWFDRLKGFVLKMQMERCLIVLTMQEGKTVAMMALESGTHRGGYICLLLVAAAGVDLEGLDLHHKSDVSSFFDPLFFSFFHFLHNQYLYP